jgi:lysyl-tRNA synthetase, class I
MGSVSGVSWVTELADRTNPPFAINDSKTPSGRAHVGALRGVLIHDSIYRELHRRDPAATTYTFGCDDYDALDELPHGLEEFYGPYLGVPLCNVPAPPGTDATDIADHYISEFFALFAELGVAATTYRMRDLYRSGRMDEVIDTVLRGKDAIRAIYQRVNGSVKPPEWHPFQVVCPNCGRIGTTIVTAYDGERVHYRCLENLVSWATGCGVEGWVSPFAGGGKLPWKIEWAARWKVLGVTIEGAGKDHTTRGGSRDVANAVAREVLGITPPLNQPYEFFLVGGSKMSSSRGVGATAAEVATLLPPQLLRFLLVRTPAKRALNFTPDLESITRLHTDYDRMLEGVQSEPPAPAAEELHRLSQIPGSGEESARVGKVLPWDTIVSLVQLPHLDFWARAEQRFDPPLSPAERIQLDQRVRSALYWLQNYALPEEKIELTAGDSHLEALTNSQRAFLRLAGDNLANVAWSPDALQAALFDAARLTPLAQGEAFAAVYLLFLGRPSGPKAGNLLAFLDRDDVLARLQGVEFSRRLLLKETALPSDVVVDGLANRRAKIESAVVGADIADGLGVASVVVTTTQGRREAVRAELTRSAGDDARQEFVASFDDFVNRLRAVADVPVEVEASAREV